MTSPQKQKRIFHLLEKGKVQIIAIQETPIREKDKKYLKNAKLGQCFISARKKKKSGIALYINNQLPTLEILNDDEGRYIAVEIKLEGKTILLVGIYGPLNGKAKFYSKLSEQISTSGGMAGR